MDHYYVPAYGADLYPLIEKPSLIVNTTIGNPDQNTFDFRNPASISVPVICEVPIDAYYEVYREGVFQFSNNWSGGSIGINCMGLGLGQHNFTIKFFNFPLFGSYAPDKSFSITGIGCPPNSPVILTSNMATASHSVFIEWSSDEWALSYCVYVNEVLYQEVTANSITLVLSDVKEYRIAVSAINEFGESALSDYIVVAIVDGGTETPKDDVSSQTDTNTYLLIGGVAGLAFIIGLFGSRLKKPHSTNPEK
jgi:hypothetical protein